MQNDPNSILFDPCKHEIAYRDEILEYTSPAPRVESRMDEDSSFSKDARELLRDQTTNVSVLGGNRYDVNDYLSDTSWYAAPPAPPKIGGKKADKSKRKAQKKARRHSRN